MGYMKSFIVLYPTAYSIYLRGGYSVLELSSGVKRSGAVAPATVQLFARRSLSKSLCVTAC